MKAWRKHQDKLSLPGRDLELKTPHSRQASPTQGMPYFLGVTLWVKQDCDCLEYASFDRSSVYCANGHDAPNALNRSYNNSDALQQTNMQTREFWGACESNMMLPMGVVMLEDKHRTFSCNCSR